MRLSFSFFHCFCFSRPASAFWSDPTAPFFLFSPCQFRESENYERVVNWWQGALGNEEVEDELPVKKCIWEETVQMSSKEIRWKECVWAVNTGVDEEMMKRKAARSCQRRSTQVLPFDLNTDIIDHPRYQCPGAAVFRTALLQLLRFIAQLFLLLTYCNQHQMEVKESKTWTSTCFRARAFINSAEIIQ